MSMELLDWAETNRARSSDPITSKIAESELNLTVRCKQFLDALKKMGPSTANEVAQQVAPNNPGLFGSIRRRASDLHKLGIVRVVERRRCKVTNKFVNVYEVVE